MKFQKTKTNIILLIIGLFSALFSITYLIFYENSKNIVSSPFTSTVEEWSPKYYSDYSEAKKKKKPVKESVPSKDTEIEDLNLLPELYSKISLSVPKKLNNIDTEDIAGINVDNWTVDNKFYETVSVKGNVRIYSVSDLKSKENFDLVEDFKDYYYGPNYSYSKGTPSIVFHGYELSPINADGPAGGMYGNFYKDKNNNLIVLTTRYDIGYTNWDPYSKEDPCPCDVTLQVFVSDPIDLDDLITRAIELDQKKSKN